MEQNYSKKVQEMFLGLKRNMDVALSIFCGGIFLKKEDDRFEEGMFCRRERPSVYLAAAVILVRLGGRECHGLGPINKGTFFNQIENYWWKNINPRIGRGLIREDIENALSLLDIGIEEAESKNQISLSPYGLKIYGEYRSRIYKCIHGRIEKIVA